MGKSYDPRGEEIHHLLEDRKGKFERMSEKEKAFFDLQDLSNPYSDTRILHGTGEEEIHTAFCGIDMEAPEILLADRLREKGRSIDLVLAHHPEGAASADLHNVMPVQADMLEKAGVPINIAEDIMKDRIAEVRRNMMPHNHQRAVDTAAWLQFPFLCVHSPADNLVGCYLDKILKRNSCRTVQDVIDSLMDMPEYQQAARFKAGPGIVVGEKKRRAGKIFLKMTGGTGGSVQAYEQLAAAGVGTIVGMHMTEAHRKAARDHHINVIIAGHMASDSLGLNLFLDELEKKGVEILPAAGLIRVKRNGVDSLEE